MKHPAILLLFAIAIPALLVPPGADAETGLTPEKVNAILANANSGLKRIPLENGMICLIKEDHAAPVVSVQIWIGTGSIHEQEHLGAGLSHAIEHMIFKGTKTRKPGDITREINDAGGSINAYTSLDRTVFHADLPARGWRVGIDVLADAVMNATFPEEEWVKEKDVILREFAMGRDNPDRVLGKLLWRTAYTMHPYKFPVIGYEDIFRDVSRSDLADFFHRNYVPDNMTTIIVGDIDAEEVEAALRTVFADFRRRARPPVVLPQEPQQLAPRFQRKTGDYEVSRLEYAYHTVPLNHPDAPALDILAEITGHGRSSTLTREIKEDLKLAHSIYSWSYTPKEPGMFGISAVFDPDKEEQLLTAIRKNIDSWFSSLFTEQELEKARRMVLSSELSDLQTMNGQSTSFATGEFYAGTPRFSETYLKRVAEVTPERIRVVARQYLKPENSTLVILSPAADSTALSPAPQQTAGPQTNVTRSVLSNGIRLIVREDHKLPFVYFSVAMAGGLLSENEANNGITRLTAELLVRGTETRSADNIASEVESLGGTLSAFSGYNSFGLQAKGFSHDAEFFLTIIADCLINAAFPEEEIEKQKTIQLAEIQQQKERPFFLAQQELRGILFPSHPYRWHPAGQEQTVKKIDRAAIVAHFGKLAVAENVVISVFGDTSLEDALQLAEAALRNMPAGKHDVTDRESVQPSLPARSKRREPRQQTILLAGFRSVDIKDPACDALTVLQSVLSGLSSDLAVSVREDRGLAYYVGALQQVGIDPGIFVIYAGTREDAVNDVEQLVVQEMTRITTDGIRAEELERARSQLIANYEMGLQNNLGLAMTCALNELYGLGHSYTFSTPERYERLTSEDIRKAADSVLSTNRMAISVVLPEKKEKINE
jgi:zinc protease